MLQSLRSARPFRRLNSGKIKAANMPWHGREQSIEINVPPLSICIFKVKKLVDKEAERAKLEKKATTRKRTTTKKAATKSDEKIEEVVEEQVKKTRRTRKTAAKVSESDTTLENGEAVKPAPKKRATRKKVEKQEEA